VPDDPPSKKPSIDKPKLKKLSRLAMREEAGGEPDLPPIDQEIMYLVGALFDAGPVSAGGMAIAPLTWTEIDAWQRCVGACFAPWEARLIRVLSAEYVNEYNAAAAHDAPMPWIPESTTERREKIARHIRNVFRG
jgi:hypothetical protein